MTSSTALLSRSQRSIKDRALAHQCASHPLFLFLAQHSLDMRQVAALLRNYDAHASVLRRLLLKAVTLMPEAAVGFILENVRNEYGNGQPDQAHQLQLLDLAQQAGVRQDLFWAQPIQSGVKQYIKEATKYYFPRGPLRGGMNRAAIAAGAITATEILALEEFKAMQLAFARLGLQDHIWFNHVKVEAEHTDESIQLAIFFMEHYEAHESVQFGLSGLLNANVMLYDGLLSAITANQ